MTDNSLIIQKRHSDGSRTFEWLAAAIGITSRQLEVGIKLILADAVSFVLASLILLGIEAALLDPSDLAELTLFDGLSLTLFLTSSAAVGLYTAVGPSPHERLRLRFRALCLFFIADLLIYALLGEVSTNLPGLAIKVAILLPLGFYAEIVVRNRLISEGIWGRATLVVGTDDWARSVFEQLESQPALGFRPVGHVSTVNNGLIQITSAGREQQVDDSILRFQNCFEVIILTHPNQCGLLERLMRGELKKCKTFIAYDVAALPTHWLRTQRLGNCVGIELPGSLQQRSNRWFKRVIDIAIAGPALLLTLPIILLSSIAIKAVDSGPALYAQKRIGMGGKEILVLKLRSMFVGAEHRLNQHLSANPAAREEWNRFFKLEDDPRVLPFIGKLIRRTSIDELPQLWNVLRGDMSIIGPRPFPSYHLQSFDEKFVKERQRVLPGLTGLWQVTSRSNGDLDHQRSQDLFYIRNWSMWLDLYIILKTPLAVLSGNGAR